MTRNLRGPARRGAATRGPVALVSAGTLAALGLGAALVAAAVGGCARDDGAGEVATVERTRAPRLPFEPGGRETGPGRYEVAIHGFSYGYEPSEIRVPAGAEITFRAISTDAHHGLSFLGTALNLSLTPGVVTTRTHTFETPGEYPFQCSEYCGGGHTAMTGKLIVE
jgi:cytochrome c oxidase subunit II